MIRAVTHIRLLEVNPGKLAALDALAAVFLSLCQQYVTLFCTKEQPDKLHEDGKGGYRFDRMTFKDPFDILGFFLGYMSCPIIEESSEERKERQSRIVTLPQRTSPTRIAS